MAICLRRGVLIFQIITYWWTFIDYQGWYKKCETYYRVNKKSFIKSVWRLEMSIFPNDISRFRCFLNIELVLQKILIIVVLLLLSPIIVIFGSSVSFFSFECDENWTRCLKSIQFIFIFNFLVNFFFYFDSLIKFFIFNQFSSLSKKINDTLIMESKSNISNFLLNFCNFFIVFKFIIVDP